MPTPTAISDTARKNLDQFIARWAERANARITSVELYETTNTDSRWALPITYTRAKVSLIHNPSGVPFTMHPWLYRPDTGRWKLGDHDYRRVHMLRDGVLPTVSRGFHSRQRMKAKRLLAELRSLHAAES